MTTNIKMASIGMYHPEHKRGNDFYLKHFEEQGRDISGLLQALNKKERHIAGEGETTLTMGIEAAKRAIEKANISVKDIDMIVFSTQVPEYIIPTNAMLVHEALGCESHVAVLDSNANCAGMTMAVEQASRYMMSNPYVQRTLVIGSDHMTAIANPNQEITYANQGDAAVAVILEKTEEETGFIDALVHTYSANTDKIIYPKEGLSKQGVGGYIDFIPFDPSFGTPIIFNLMETLFERNALSPQNMAGYFLSQFAYDDTLKIQKHFGLTDEQMNFVGHRFGYTGTTSPFLALHEAIEEGRINRGDYLMFWTVGAGHQFIAMLFKY